MQGAAVKEGILASLPIPKASTATEGHAAQTCLRALTTALLCFYETNTVADILAAVLPYGLLHFDQEGVDIKIEGPIYAAIRQYVIAVAKEEDTDPLRQTLLQAIEAKRRTVSGSSLKEVISSCMYKPTDLSFSIGLLRWVLTSLHRRHHECYPTRSFTVWALAVVLSELGFQVSASLWAVSNEEDYELQVSNASYRTGHPDVILVTASVGHTDPMALGATTLGPDVSYKPQLLPIRAIPCVAFNHLACNAGKVNTQFLSDVWDFSFEHVQRAIGSVQLNPRVQLKAISDTGSIHNEHKRLAAFWSIHIEEIIRAPMLRFMSHDDGISELVEPLGKHFLHHAGLQNTPNFGSDALDHWHIMTAIVLATIFSACCKCLRQDGKLAGPQTQVAFHSSYIYRPKVYNWADVVGRAMKGLASSAEWIGMLLEVVTGVEHPKPLTDMSTNVLSRSWQLIPSGNASLEQSTVTDVFGVQTNGIVLLSDFLIRPTTQPDSLITYHVQYGQILDFPIEDCGYIRAAKTVRPICSLPLNGEYRDILGDDSLRNSPSFPIRLDVEPDWEGDPRLIVLRARREGVVVATISAELLSKRIHYTTLRCKCGKLTPTALVDRNERWQVVTIAEILGAHGSRVAIDRNSRVYVCTYGDEIARLVCAGLLECRDLGIVRDCVSCACVAMLAKKGLGGVLIG